MSSHYLETHARLAHDGGLFETLSIIGQAPLRGRNLKSSNTSTIYRQLVIEKIEEMLGNVVEGLSNDQILSVPIYSRPRSGSTTSSALRKNLEYPGASPRDAWRFCVAIRILELVHEALVKDIITSKRNMYYKDPSLFIKQGVVDRFVDDLAFTLGVQRSDLNVIAAAKGLVAGKFSIAHADGTSTDSTASTEGMLIPSLNPTDTIELSSILCVLVIEKEATYRTLVGSSQFKQQLQSCILITGKGYPDIQTRALLHQINRVEPLIPIYALVDWDPDGIAIYLTYAHGSLSLAHESHALKVPSMKWLGIRSEDIFQDTELPCSSTGSAGPIELIDKAQAEEPPISERRTAEGAGRREQLIPMSDRDRKKAVAMLSRAAVSSQERRDACSWQRELQVMLMLGMKAEIQGIEGDGDRLVELLKTKMRL